MSTMRALRSQASETSNEDFRRIIAERLRDDKLDPRNILAALLHDPLSSLPAGN